MIYNNKLVGAPRGLKNLAGLCIAIEAHGCRTIGGFVKRASLATVSVAAVMMASAANSSVQAAEAAEDAEIIQLAQAPSAQSAASDQVVEEIIVTGSQIVRRGYEAPTPVTVTNVADIQTQAPTNIADYLTKLPAFANSATARNSANSVSGGTGGQASLNLKGLGANRTLILMDGMRIAPSSMGSGGGSVDTNGLPDALFSRIDVVTGGASAAYGSDALAGVVNFVLDKDFTGLKGTINGGATVHNDDYQFLVDLTGGTGFANDRGHFLLSGSLNHVEGVPDGYRRGWIRQGWDLITNPARTATNGLPFYTVAKNVGSGLYTPGGLIASGPLKGINFGPNGTSRMFKYGALSPGNATMIGGDWLETIGSLNDAAEGWIISLDNMVWRHNLFTRMSYDVSDKVTVYAQFMYSSTLTSSNAYVSTQTFTINSGNPFIPTDVQTRMSALGVTSFSLGKWNDDIPPIEVRNRRDLRHYVVGADGAFSAFDRDWSWNAAISRSETRQVIRDYNMPNVAKLRNAANVVRHPTTGAPVCVSTLTNPNDGCMPYNPMGTGMNSDATIDYALKGVSRLNQRIHQNEAVATLRGEPVSTWAGPVSMAAGLEYRWQSVNGFSSPEDDANQFFAANFHPTVGSYSIVEGFAEAVVPIAKDVAWARSLDLNAALRETSYSTSGLVTTWKIGATYDTPLSGLRLRSHRSQDIRAPNLGELYSTGSSGQNSQQDPFKNNQTVTNVLSITTGNPNLNPEKAANTGVGVVYQPEWLPGLSGSVDYYHTKITGAIASVSAQNELAQCFAGVTVYCSKIIRDDAGNLRIIYISPENTAFTKMSGIDFELSYRANLAEFSESLDGTLSLRGLLQRTLDFTEISPIGFATQRAGVNASGNLPTWRYIINVGYELEDVTLSWTGRGVSAGVLSNLYTQCTSACPALVSPYFTIDDNSQPAAFYMDASVSYRYRTEGGSTLDFFLNVENLANSTPKTFVHLTSGNGLYDKLGTIFRTGIRFRM